MNAGSYEAVPPDPDAHGDFVSRHRKPLVYIAGPYTNPDPVINTRSAVTFAESLPRSVIPVVPHLTMLWHLICPHPLEWWYEHDLDMLAHCDALIRLPGRSTGADKEVAFARSAGIPTFLSVAYHEDFDAWLDRWAS